jgi:ribosome-associated protein
VSVPTPELPPPGNSIDITAELSIPLAEVRFRYSRSSGPGGQNVNRTETRVELLFDVARSEVLPEHQKVRLLTRLAGQIDADGVLHIVSSATRSQYENRADALLRFQALLRSALRLEKKRRASKPGPAARERRLAAKKARGEIKRGRGAVTPAE